MAVSKITGDFIISKPSDFVLLVSITLHSDSLPTSDPTFLVSFRDHQLPLPMIEI